jgi:hypothetical protein
LKKDLRGENFSRYSTQYEGSRLRNFAALKYKIALQFNVIQLQIQLMHCNLKPSSGSYKNQGKSQEKLEIKSLVNTLSQFFCGSFMCGDFIFAVKFFEVKIFAVKYLAVKYLTYLNRKNAFVSALIIQFFFIKNGYFYGSH